MKLILRRKKAFWLAPVVLALLLGAFVFPLVTSSQKVEAAAPDDPLVGYGAGTTGGQGGPTVTVTTLSGLVSAVSGSSAKIVQISGVISGNQNVMVGSNTTILGVGAGSGLKGLSLDLDAVSNVIIRNLTMSFVLASSTTGDEVHIINGANHVWIDHNELYDDLNHGKDYYDGQIDITHAADYITVSWNRLHDHFKSSLVGHVDTNGAQDTGHLHVTYHHNWFYNVNSRTPSLRFGTAHVYNNYFQNIPTSGAHSRMGAQMLVENNVFRNVPTPITTTGDSTQDGYANARGNDYGGGTPNITQVGTFTQAPYSYTLDPASSVISEVSAYSGVGIISGGSGGGSTPTPVPTSNPGGNTSPNIHSSGNADATANVYSSSNADATANVYSHIW